MALTSLAVTDGTTTVEGVTALTVSGALVTDEGAGEAAVRPESLRWENEQGVVYELAFLDGAIQITVTDADENVRHRTRFASNLLQTALLDAEGAAEGGALNVGGSASLQFYGSNGNKRVYIDDDTLRISADDGGANFIEIGLTPTFLSIDGLPTSDPAIAGALWNDTGTLKVSAG